jgi:hypothetical protein
MYSKLIIGVFAGIGLFILVCALGLLFAVVTQYTWAHSIAEIFHLPELTFWQAFCLNVFGGMVFKGSSGSSSK